MISRIFISGMIFFSSVISAFAACSNDGNLTQSVFRLDVGCMDPVGGNGSTAAGGVEVLQSLLGRVANVLLFAVPILAALSFLVAGYFYIFSAGDSEKVGKAKNIIKWNLIAITVALLSYGIVSLIASFFS